MVLVPHTNSDEYSYLSSLLMDTQRSKEELKEQFKKQFGQVTVTLTIVRTYERTFSEDFRHQGGTDHHLGHWSLCRVRRRSIPPEAVPS